MDKATRKMLTRINNAQIPPNKLMELALELDDANNSAKFEQHVIAAIRVFEGEHDLVFSAVFRMQALARLLYEEELPGWARPQVNDSKLVHAAIFKAASVEPVTVRDDKFIFDRDKLLKRAFQIAKK